MSSSGILLAAFSFAEVIHHDHYTKENKLTTESWSKRAGAAQDLRDLRHIWY